MTLTERATAPSTAEYQRQRNATLRAIAHSKILDTALEMAKHNRKHGHKYTHKTMNILRGKPQ